ncbi:four helix bundle protein [Fodinibius sp.]|uniref:four helix bundle protein n=1 Tax=Fodinibius sp. TaxID=1872440 RepID=UPI002ACD478B|nr:four helix bundle protein [Fodinibius sp.]MDZ7658275.1 four helix bundle protein [Fodinibius sp.]
MSNYQIGKYIRKVNMRVWNLKVYRAALYLSDLCWKDTQMIKDQRYFSLADQLYRAVGSISANITEGYSRNSPKEKARFYEIALGSARESKGWYFKSRHILGGKTALHRIKLLTSVIKLLLRMINEKRSSAKISEKEVGYLISDIEGNL